ncbi:MAG: HAMP domain-containing sensor histidine kinase [Bacteroidota bacterium]
MNLIARISLLFILVSLVVFSIGGVISYHILMGEVQAEQKRFLIERLDRVTNRIERFQPRDTIRWSKMVSYPMADYQQEQYTFSDTLVMHAQLDRMEPHLKLDAIRNIGGKSYRTVLYDVIIEEDDIKDGIVESLITMYLILLGAIAIIGVGASYFILRPFNLTLAEIRNFSLRDPSQQTSFPRSSVTEFKKLNVFLKAMTDKVRSDYRSLKEFSENASHEFQTPIAIVQSKLEVLMDDPDLSEIHLEQLGAMQNAVRRLSSLSSSLALLTRIENKEFSNVASLDVSKRIVGLLDEFSELMDLKQINLQKSIQDNLVLKVDQTLIELLFTNLINNAIRHNFKEGTIKVLLTDDEFKISNTGKPLEIPASGLFERFKKSNQSSRSMGLGLAIVKKICDLYHFQPKYSVEEEVHTVQIIFYPSKESI